MPAGAPERREYISYQSLFQPNIYQGEDEKQPHSLCVQASGQVFDLFTIQSYLTSIDGAGYESFYRNVTLIGIDRNAFITLYGDLLRRVH